ASSLGRWLLAAAIAIGVAWALVVRRDLQPAPQRAAVRRPNVLLVTLDTTRADHTSAYGYRRPTTPRLAQLAQEGVRFQIAYAPMAATTPSHATIFTALEPRTHGVLRNGASLASSRLTLAEVLERHGYQTGAVVSAYPLHRTFGLARGFDTYDDDFATRDGE